MRDLVYVEWVDSAGQDGWVDRQTALSGSIPSRVRSVGIVLHEDDESITLVTGEDTTHDNVDNPITIPKVAVTRRHGLRRRVW